MNNRIRPAAISMFSTSLFIALALFASQRAGAAPVVITKTGYTLTYQDGWMSAVASQDGSYTLMNTSLSSAFVFGQGVPISAGMDAATYAHLLTSAYTSQFHVIDSTTKTIGANSFIVTTMKDTSAEADSVSRIRIYVTSKNGFLFVSWVMYDLTEQAAVTAQEEAALATLNINFIAAIRNVSNIRAGNGNVSSHPGYDIQGRNRKPVENRIPGVAIFRKL